MSPNRFSSRFVLLSWFTLLFGDLITLFKMAVRISHNFAALLLVSHWGRVTHMCVGKLTIMGSDNGLSPERHQAIIWTNAGILLIGHLGINCSGILIEIQTFSLKKIRLTMSSVKCCSFCLGLNVLTPWRETWSVQTPSRPCFECIYQSSSHASPC